MHNFWHGGHYFRLQRKVESFMQDGGGYTTFKDKEDMIITCFGRSPGMSLSRDASHEAIFPDGETLTKGPSASFDQTPSSASCSTARTTTTRTITRGRR